MVEFFDTYSSAEFHALFERLRLDEFVQSVTAQSLLSVTAIASSELINSLQSLTANAGENMLYTTVLPSFLALTTFTNHTEIVNRCRTMEEKVFDILYSARERLNLRELRRAIVTQTYGSVMSKEKKVSKHLTEM